MDPDDIELLRSATPAPRASTWEKAHARVAHEGRARGGPWASGHPSTPETSASTSSGRHHSPCRRCRHDRGHLRYGVFSPLTNS